MRHMVDVCGGIMEPSCAIKEIEFYLRRNPRRMVIDFKKVRTRYKVTIYITQKDFTKGGSK